VCSPTATNCHELPRAQFDQRGLAYDAILRNIELLGEAARHISEEERQKTPDIDWRGVIAVRNILVHGYLGVDDDILWDVIHQRIPELKRLLEELRRQL
jgi:uncharacterized protein with HEPN domain